MAQGWRDSPLESRGKAGALDVSREVFGLMNVWAGFAVQPDRQRR
jgi:hypothetical protein